MLINSQYYECPKHKNGAIYICTFNGCQSNILICSKCKSNQTLHFSHHDKYIYNLKDFQQFHRSKSTVTKLENGLEQCEGLITKYKNLSKSLLMSIKDKVSIMKNQFLIRIERFQASYVLDLEKKMNRYDQMAQDAKKNLKDYIREKKHHQSFFASLFQDKKHQLSLEDLLKRNQKAFKTRANIITLQSELKSQQNDKVVLGDQFQNFKCVHECLISSTNNIIDEFKKMLRTQNEKQMIKRSSPESRKLNKVSLQVTAQKYPQQFINNPLPNVPLLKLSQQVQKIYRKLKVFPFERDYRSQTLQIYPTGIYYGAKNNKSRQGFGIFIFKDGSLYEGEWKNDKMCGYGRIVRKNNYYEGQIINGKANGKGQYQDEKLSYSGEWKEDQRQGAGEQRSKRKMKRYVGMFSKNKYHGKGKLIDEEYTYEGQFECGRFHGNGTISYIKEEVFTGKFENGVKVMGKYTYKGGNFYEGAFRDDLPNGIGRFCWADGLIYEGQWKNGQQNGEGIQIHTDGTQLKGVWSHGKWQRWL